RTGSSPASNPAMARPPAGSPETQIARTPSRPDVRRTTSKSDIPHNNPSPDESGLMPLPAYEEDPPRRSRASNPSAPAPRQSRAAIAARAERAPEPEAAPDDDFRATGDVDPGDAEATLPPPPSAKRRPTGEHKRRASNPAIRRADLEPRKS